MASSISRRRFLRHAASASAFAVAGVTAAAAAGSSHPDADLIALGEEFDNVFPRERAAWKAANEAVKAFDAAFPGKRFDPARKLHARLLDGLLRLNGRTPRRRG